LERTAVIGFNQPVKLANAVNDDTKLMLARQAAFPCWASTFGRASEIAGVCYVSDSDSVALSSGATLSCEYEFGPHSFHVVNGTSGATIETVGAAGDLYDHFPLGSDRQQGLLPFAPRFLGGSSAVVVYDADGTPLPAGVTIIVHLQTWFAPGQSRETTVSVVLPASFTGAAVITPPATSSDICEWVRPMRVTLNFTTSSNAPLKMGVGLFVGANALAYAPSAVTAGALTSSGNTQRSFRPIVGPAEFGVSRIPYEATRVTACSCLLTNVTQILNKSGTVIAGRLNPNTTNPFAADETALMSLHPAEKAWLPLETGLYTYCPPSTDLANFWDYSLAQTFVDSTTMEWYPVYRLDNDSLVNIAIMNAGVASNFGVTVTTHLEYRTTSALFQLALSGYTLETLHVAQLALASAGFFFENPEHNSVLSKVVMGIKKLAPFVEPAVSMLKATPYGQAAAAAYNAGRAFVKTAARPPTKLPVKAGPQKQVTTSLRGIGLVPKTAVVVRRKGKSKKKK
jgi:hypothetical protein